MAPFGLLLGAMALGPILAHGWWLRHYAKVALGLGAVTVTYYLVSLHARAPIGHAVHEYVSFVTLVGGLFVISGGIHIGVKGRGSPLLNTGFLLLGAVLANVLGTTGAAMLLIRPWIRLNQARIQAYHIVFFIFIVANAGGCLTPIGDPPLFLGYLQGVPFWWVAEHCWPMWSLGVGLLLAIFFGLDSYNERPAAPRHIPSVSRITVEGSASSPRRANEEGRMKNEETGGRMEKREKTPSWPDSRSDGSVNADWKFEGRANLIFLAVLLGAVFIRQPVFLREGLMAAAAAGSYFTTKKSVHAANGFNFHPLAEVAILFAGIFATMIPALAWLELQAPNLLGPSASPGVFYWGTGVLSSLLDNAPTYLAFFSSLTGVAGVADTATLLQQHSLAVAGISVGAVFFGAATYIGNGPNLMVKAIAEQEKIPLPAFMELVFKYSLPWLLPVLVIEWLVFFR